MNKCTCINCQYETFLQDKSLDEQHLYYFKEKEQGDLYCIFHAPEEVKEKFTYYQNELLKKTILDYIDFCIEEKQTIDFSQSVFHIPFEVNDLKEVETIDFTETIFIEYFRMDNLECKEIIFQDTEFHDGGGIKNRNGKEKVKIEKLIFRPYQLESDFVIDIGKYANSKGLIESNHYGIIEKIRFENHKKGNGIIYFIGLNKHIEEADFRNMILDDVSFQNCDLCKCYFLNAKVDNTEFRNCEFPQGYVYSSYDVLRGKTERLLPFGISIIILILIGIIFYFGHTSIIAKLMTIFIDTIESLEILFIFISPFLILFFFYILGNIVIYIESKIAQSELENSKHGSHTLNSLKSIGRHFSIADEVKLYKELHNVRIESDSHKGQIMDSFKALSATYIQLKNNFSKYDYQMSGSFFYVQRYFELLTSRNKGQMSERLMLITHHFVNGFGERFIKPILFFVITILLFSFIYWYSLNLSFENRIVATNITPQFLLDKNSTKNIYLASKILTIDSNKSKRFVEKQFQEYKLNTSYSTAFIYSASKFISPLTLNTKIWFKTEGRFLIFLNFTETLLLLFFFGAFILALKNRIKR